MTDEVWEEFRRTCVHIDTASGSIRIAPDPSDDPGAFLPGASGPIHILTAHNPMGLAARSQDNDAANARLADELGQMDDLTIWPATGYGGGPIDDDTWREAGFAVQGLTRHEAIAMAERFGQRAIFEWRDEPGGFRLVACDGSADEPRGWTSTFPERP